MNSFFQSDSLTLSELVQIYTGVQLHKLCHIGNDLSDKELQVLEEKIVWFDQHREFLSRCYSIEMIQILFQFPNSKGECS